MRRVYRAPDKKVYIRSLLKQKLAYQRGAVVLKAPLLVALIVTEIILCVRQHLVDRNNPLGDKIDALYLGDRRYVRLLKIQACLERFSEILGRNRRGSSSAYNMLALL